MNIPITVAVRVLAPADQPCVVQSIPSSSHPHPSISNDDVPGGQPPAPPPIPGIIQLGLRSFPFAHALPVDCSQDQLYLQTVHPMLGMFLEGYDASFVTYGQSATGKTHTMLGPGLNCVYGEAEQGIVLRCVRDIFAALALYRGRNFAVHIGWVEVSGDEINDLFQNSGNVPCATVSDVFHWLQVGMANRRKATSRPSGGGAVHSIFTLTLEQQWVTPVEGLIQHRLSTASFCDLAATDRISRLQHVDLELQDQQLGDIDLPDEETQTVPNDPGLRALEEIVKDLAHIEFGDQEPAYERTTLTTLLKDSFGGRAQTLLILCLSGRAADASESMHNLQFAYKAQCVRNYVVVNEFSDNNTPVNAAAIAGGLETVGLCVGAGGVGMDGGGGGGIGVGATGDTFGLQFAASQWLKLVSNAEGLFSRLIESKGLDEKERERIEEWMFLKQECEECLSSGEIQLGGMERHLGPIQEETSEPDEDEEEEDDDEASCQQNTDNDSDTESQQLVDLEDRVVQLMGEFGTKTDNLVREKYDVFVKTHPKAVLDSHEQLDVRRTSSPGRSHGRRKSFKPGDNLILTSQDIERLHQVAESGVADAAADRNRLLSVDPFVDNTTDDFLLRSVSRDPLEQLENELRRVRCDIEATELQCKELEGTVQTKQELIKTLSCDAHNRAGFAKKRARLEADYQKCKKQLNKAVANRKGGSAEVEHLRALAHSKKQLLTEFISLNNSEECGAKIKIHQKDQKAVKKKLEALHKVLKKNKKHESELLGDRRKLEKAAPVGGGGGDAGAGCSNALALPGTLAAVDVNERISHLDQVIKEKSLKQYSADNSSNNSDLFRHEIRQLRLTRDQLVDQRCSIDQKLKHDKRISPVEQRKLFECDEGIEAIDAAIEYKNELICGGRRSVDTAAALQREKGSRMMMARLNNLSVDEMRVLLYKYFQKAIDFRDNSQQMEKDRDLWESRARQLNNELLRMRYQSDRRVAMLHHQHEVKLAMYMRIINDSGLTDTMSSSATSATNAVVGGVEQRMLSRRPAALEMMEQPQSGGHQHLVKSSGRHLQTTEMNYLRHRPVTSAFGAAGTSTTTTTTAASSALGKFKEKDKTSAKFFSKIQMFKTHYGSSATAKVHDSSLTIPEQQVRSLFGSAQHGSGGVGVGAKVTREKNKLVIQQDGSR